MINPYTVTAEGNETTAHLNPDSRGRMFIRGLVAGLSVMAIVAFLLIALVLLTQATRLSSDAASLPADVRAKIQKLGDASIRASWIGGGTAIGCAIANVAVLFLIRNRKTILSLGLFAVSVACMAAVALLFKPV